MQARVSHRVRLDSANDVGIFCKFMWQRGADLRAMARSQSKDRHTNGCAKLNLIKGPDWGAVRAIESRRFVRPVYCVLRPGL